MDNTNNSNRLNRFKNSQEFIYTDNTQRNLEIFNDLFLEHKNEIDKYIKDSNETEKAFWLKFYEKKSFDMSINPHIIKYVFHHKNNINKVYRYLNYRYFFEQVATKKMDTDYPPYLLIEPVSACQLRCPFCFQSDKTFTKKPFMGVMKLELFKKIVDEADNLGVGAITIASRGEPTMHKTIVEKHKYVGSKKNNF